MALDRLRPCRYQKRAVSSERVRQLAETIKQNGLLQNVTARPVAGDTDHDYELIAGHRRTEAFRRLHQDATTPEERDRWSRIPCTLKLGLSEVQVAALAAIENLERDDGDPVEQSLSILEVKKAGGFTTNAQVAEATGMGLQKVTRLLRLAEAPELFQKAVAPGVLVEVAEQDGVVRNQHVKLEVSLALAVLPYLRHQENILGRPVALARTERLLQRIAKGNWPRTRVEAEVKKLLAGNREDGSPVEPTKPVDAEEPMPVEAPGAVGHRRQLFRDKGMQFVIYPRNAATASPDERRTLLTHLKKLIAELTLEEPPPTES